MKIAFLSDIHGNYEALKAVFLELKKKKISKVVCLGDYLNYYYEPKKCLDLLIKKKAICIKGNHEEIFLETLKNKKKIKSYADKYGNSIYINLKQLNQKYIDYIKFLPKNINIKIGSKRTLISHGSPWKIDFYFYKNIEDKWKKKIRKYNKELFILGHTHHPMILKLINKKKMVLNPGSVGQPRNGTSDACWMIIDDKSMRTEFMKTPYNTKKLINQIKKNDPGKKNLLKYFI